MNEEKVTVMSTDSLETKETTQADDKFYIKGTAYNRITIDELLAGMKQRSSADLKKKFVESKVKIAPYVNYPMKMFLADRIIENSCLNKDRELYINSCKKYIMYIYALMENWTNLKIDVNNWTSQYDTLEETGLLDILLEMIPESERSAFSTVLAMKEDDLMKNEFSLQGLLKKVSKLMEPSIQNLSEVVDNIDVAKTAAGIERIVKVFNK